MLAELQDLVQDQVPLDRSMRLASAGDAVDGEAAITVVTTFSSADQAADSVASLERLYREGLNLFTNQPISESVTIEDIAAAEMSSR